MGKDVELIKDLELKPEHIENKDILISLGIDKIVVIIEYRRRRYLFESKWFNKKPKYANTWPKH